MVSVVLLLLPFGAAYLDGIWDEFLREGHWRVASLAPVIILYIWFIAPTMSRGQAGVARSIRPLVPLDDEAFEQLVAQAPGIEARHEWTTVLIGALLGLLSAGASEFDGSITWLLIYWYAAMAGMYALLAWVILGAIASTRLNAAYHRQPLQVDILDPKPLEAVGRQSLMLALVFIGGITFSMLLTLQSDNIGSPVFWLTYLLMVLAVLLIFFLNMRPTHRLLAESKRRELEPLERRINELCRELMRGGEGGQNPGSLPAEINALVAYEARLQTARTWPYNTGMLRTLFFSVFIPIGSLMARLLAEVVMG
jgi:hypothetical protein